MSATLHVLLEAEPRLEGDVADGEADPSACHSIGQEERLPPWTTNMCLDRLDYLEKVLRQWLHCASEQGRAASNR